MLAQNTLHGLVPLYPSDYEEKKKLKIGETYEVNIKKPRNVGFHRKFFALVNLAHQNSKLDMPFDAFRRYLIMKAGFFNSYCTYKGEYFEAQSISFASMDNEKFQEVYDRVMDVVIEMLDSSKSDIAEEIENFM